MLGYILVIIAVLVVVPLAFLLLRGRQKPAPTAAEDPRSGTILQQPAREQPKAPDGTASREGPSASR